MPPEPGRRVRPPVVTIAIVILFVLFWMAQAAGVSEWTARHDVLSFYTGASFALDGRWEEMYDTQAQLQFQQQIFPDVEAIAPYIRPNYYAALVAPWAVVPYRTAFWVWMGLHTAVLLGCLWWAGRRFHWDAMIWGSMFFPAFVGVSNGQDCAWMLAIAAAAFALGEKNRSFAAGAVFGVGLIKFNLLILLPLAMAANRRWRMLAGYCTAAAAVALLFLALGGAGTIAAYRELITNADIAWLEPNPDRMINLTSIGANFGLPQPAVYASAGLTALLAIWAGRKAPFWLWLSLAMIGSVLINPHAYSYDGGMLLLPVWLVLFLSKDALSRSLAAMIAIPIPFYTLLVGSPWCVIPAILLVALFASLVRLAFRPHPEHLELRHTIPARS